MYKLDSKQYMARVDESRKLADKALARYGRPTMSLDELRLTLERELEHVSLSDLINKDRESGW